MNWWEWPYGPSNRVANALNRAWNYDRNPLSQYYRFPVESLWASPPMRTALPSLIAVLGFIIGSPLLSRWPGIWPATVDVTYAFWSAAVVVGFSGWISGDETVRWWERPLLVIVMVTGIVLPFMWAASALRALGWPW